MINRIYTSFIRHPECLKFKVTPVLNSKIKPYGLSKVMDLAWHFPIFSGNLTLFYLGFRFIRFHPYDSDDLNMLALTCQQIGEIRFIFIKYTWEPKMKSWKYVRKATNWIISFLKIRNLPLNYTLLCFTLRMVNLMLKSSFLWNWKCQPSWNSSVVSLSWSLAALHGNLCMHL